MRPMQSTRLAQAMAMAAETMAAEMIATTAEVETKGSWHLVAVGRVKVAVERAMAAAGPRAGVLG